MPRDMTGTGRYPPQPKHKPIAFYSSIRLGDPEQLASIQAVDPYFITQDNGAGAPLHFATTYKQLDMVNSSALPALSAELKPEKGLLLKLYVALSQCLPDSKVSVILHQSAYMTFCFLQDDNMCL